MPSSPLSVPSSPSPSPPPASSSRQRSRRALSPKRNSDIRRTNLRKKRRTPDASSDPSWRGSDDDAAAASPDDSPASTRGQKRKSRRLVLGGGSSDDSVGMSDIDDEDFHSGDSLNDGKRRKKKKKKQQRSQANRKRRASVSHSLLPDNNLDARRVEKEYEENITMKRRYRREAAAAETRKKRRRAVAAAERDSSDSDLDLGKGVTISFGGAETPSAATPKSNAKESEKDAASRKKVVRRKIPASNSSKVSPVQLSHAAHGDSPFVVESPMPSTRSSATHSSSVNAYLTKRGQLRYHVELLSTAEFLASNSPVSVTARVRSLISHLPLMFWQSLLCCVMSFWSRVGG